MPVPPQIVLPVRIRYEGRGATIKDAEGFECYFPDRLAALSVHALLNELHDLRQAVCKEPHCDEGNCHQHGECPPQEPDW